MDIHDMSVEQLEEAKTLYDEQMKSAKFMKTQLMDELNSRMTQESVVRKLDAMSDVEKSMLHQMLSAQGVASAMQVGVPGT
jgi:hypothetical protein